MDDDFFDIVELVSKYMTGELTGTERESLDNWLSLSEDNRKWFHEVTEKEFIYRKRQELRSIDVKGGWKLFLVNESRRIGGDWGFVR